MKDIKDNCGMHEELVAYLYGEATAEEAGRVETHLKQCGPCKDELDAFERVRGMLQQWQLDDLPVVRVAMAGPRRSFVESLKELFSIAPLWVKAAGAVAMGLLLLAITGSEIRIGSGGVTFRADLLRRNQPVERPDSASPNGRDVEQIRADVKALVNQLIADSEQRRSEELTSRLVRLESQLQTMRSADLAKLETRIQEHQMKIRTLERDIDRREGLDLTDILFSEVMRPPHDDRLASGGGD